MPELYIPEAGVEEEGALVFVGKKKCTVHHTDIKEETFGGNIKQIVMREMVFSLCFVGEEVHRFSYDAGKLSNMQTSPYYREEP